jgi:hypothetical protein
MFWVICVALVVVILCRRRCYGLSFLRPQNFDVFLFHEVDYFCFFVPSPLIFKVATLVFIGGLTVWVGDLVSLYGV